MSKKVNKTQDLFSVMEFGTNSVVEESNKEILVDVEKKINSEEKKNYKNLKTILKKWKTKSIKYILLRKSKKLP
jgi:hypothetical protein